VTQQPEALRLADALARALKQTDAEDDVIDVPRWFVEDSAAELRRLYQLAQEQHTEIYGLRLEVRNLLKALELADLLLSGANMNRNVVERKVRAAIESAHGIEETK
jgi:ribosome biogenesis protein Nip4